MLDVPKVSHWERPGQLVAGRGPCLQCSNIFRGNSHDPRLLPTQGRRRLDFPLDWGIHRCLDYTPALKFQLNTSFTFPRRCCSVAQLCLTLCDLMDCSTLGFPVLQYLPECAQSHVHWVHDAIQPSHPLPPPSPPALYLSQHQGLFQWVCFLHQVAEVLELPGHKPHLLSILWKQGPRWERADLSGTTLSLPSVPSLAPPSEPCAHCPHKGAALSLPLGALRGPEQSSSAAVRVHTTLWHSWMTCVKPTNVSRKIRRNHLKTMRNRSFIETDNVLSPSVMSNSVTPWTVAHEFLCPRGFSGWEYWKTFIFPFNFFFC